MMEAGNYYAQLVKGMASQSSKGTPQIVLTFQITHFAVNGQWEDIDQPTQRTVYLYCSDAAWETTHAKLTTLGFNGKFNDEMDFSPEAKSGIELVCAHETYEGKPKEKWELANWGGGFEHKPADADTVRKLAARWKKTVQTAPKSAAAPKPAGKPKPPTREPITVPANGHAPIDPSEIPF
jgi:hypothetical protein